MNATAYGERDYTFGQAMLTLRTKIGLTQVGLANVLGVSRRAVVEWEAGKCYPKAEHLKELIALAVLQQAFRTGHEAEEIRVLWKAARQKVLLDESWLASLLEHSRSPHLQLVPKVVEESITVETGLASVQGASPLPTPTPTPPVPRPRVDWDDALAVPSFYGREEELAQLTQWIVQEHCRMVGVLGMGGIGKSALSVSAMYKLSVGTEACPCPFDVVIFRSLRDAPSCEDLIAECLQVLSPQSLGQAQPVALERWISLMLSLLHTNRALVVLDNLECLLQEGDVKGHFRPGFEGYGQLLRRVAETGHQSCLLFTSREKPADFRSLGGKLSSVRSLRLSGLDVVACKQLLVEKGLAPELTSGVGIEADQERLIGLCGGNPLALKIVAETIIDLFGGEVSAFLSAGTVLFGSVTDLLGEQFSRLSALERSVLYWLAIVREPATLDELLELLVTPLPHVQVLEAIDAGYRRSLIERGKRPGSFTLQSVVLEYVTAHLVAEGSREIQQYQLDRLIEYGLSQANAKEYVQQIQERLLLRPLLANLQSAIRWGQTPDRGQPYPPLRPERAGGEGLVSLPYASSPTPTVPIEERLLGLLNQLRSLSEAAQGYGPANLIALLRLLRGNLNSLDLSMLSIRGASLQGIEMQDTNLSGAIIRDTVWTSAISATWCVAISQDGTLWAINSMQGEIRVWEEGGRTLRLVWHAHADTIMALAFSPNGRMLASGGVDRTVKLWDLEACNHGAGSHEALLWMDWQNAPQSLAFSPDGSLLACSGVGETVRIWDAESGTALQNLVHPAHVFTVVWCPDGKLLASACSDGQLRLWKRQEAEPPSSGEILQLVVNWQTSPVWSLAFSPDGRTLASSDWDRKVKLWEVRTGRLLHTFEGETGKTNRPNRVVWSPDGRILASCIDEHVIQLWNVEQRSVRSTLYGHVSDIDGMAFTPDSHSLVSGSTDSTLRVWDVESGQCVRVMQGYGASYYDLDWSPNGTHLVSGAMDGLVTIWDMRTETPPKELRGHSWVVRGVGWSPDGRFVASASWDMIMRLWNPTSGVCVQIFRDPPTLLAGLAWSPDGNFLAVGTFLQGMYVWNMREGRPRFVLEPDRTAFISAAWSPDGSFLAGGCDDGRVYLWESANGMRREWECPDGSRRKWLLGHRGNVISIAWSPDGRFLASGSGKLSLWDVQTGECLRTFAEHPGVVYAVAWSRSHGASPSGEQLISGASDGRLRWWDIVTGECISMQVAHHGTIRSLKVSPDGQFLASCGNDGAIQIWDLITREHLRTLRRDRPYERLNITEIRGLSEAQKNTIMALGAIEEKIS